MSTNYYLVKTKPTLVAPLHIGKHSGGWKFLFNYVNKYDTDWEVELHSYEDWINFIENVLDNQEAVILNEYDERVYFIDLLTTIGAAQKNENPDNFQWSMNIDGYRFERGEFY